MRPFGPAEQELLGPGEGHQRERLGLAESLGLLALPPSGVRRCELSQMWLGCFSEREFSEVRGWGADDPWRELRVSGGLL